MQTYDYYATSRVRMGDVYRADKDGVAYLTCIDRDNGHDYDGCGAVVAPALLNDEHNVELLPSRGACPNGCCASKAYALVADAWNRIVRADMDACERDWEREGLDVWEREGLEVREVAYQVKRIARRFGYGVTFVCPDYYGTWHVSPFPDVDNYKDPWFIVVDEYGEDAAVDYAKMVVAYKNGETWVVGTMSVEEADELGEDATPWECEWPVHGYVWENVDERGESSPTEDELLACM